MSKESHIDRTATEPRHAALHETTIISLQEINPSIRLFRLAIQGSGIKFLPGQWLDLHIPSLSKPGGFTITSSPSSSLPSPSNPTPYVELAIQRSPSNPAAAYLFQPPFQLLNTPLSVRVGGSFTFPPSGIPASTLRRVVFIAGGVGVNPLMSMLSFLAEAPPPEPFEAHFLYSMRDPGMSRDAKGMLFLERIFELFSKGGVQSRLRLFLTSGRRDVEQVAGSEVVSLEGGEVPFERRRISLSDVGAALGEEKRDAVVYVCGVPDMTDEFVKRLVDELGMERERVLYEKWW
ncbi:hypothetical protein B0T16DRAFT_404511 [Cercophora newfieldiana]|uniref:FAD-binding FR-type domain-containing protein n=1 Tax=Cercophora newfieldiana TaxID=92897 RepID=A0AA39YGX8_9PEZI|nr:hypothetical protein B0T16DRAFT_404511 [Cercophora newfieldiana]